MQHPPYRPPGQPNPWNPPPPQPYPQPGQYVPGPPRKKRSRRFWFVVGSGLVLLMVAAIISNIVQAAPHKETETTPTAQPTHAAQATSVPTQELSPTPTKSLVGTSPSRSTIEQFLTKNELEVSIGSYDQQRGVLVLQQTVGYALTLSQFQAKQFLSDMQTKLWQQQWYFASVTANLYQYQESGPTKKIASGLITWKTAQSIHWDVVFDLWSHYDQKYLDSSLPT